MNVEIFVDGKPIFTITDSFDPISGVCIHGCLDAFGYSYHDHRDSFTEAMECVGYALDKIKERDSIPENSFSNALGSSTTGSDGWLPKTTVAPS
jgi:hypothetical protein